MMSNVNYLGCLLERKRSIKNFQISPEGLFVSVSLYSVIRFIKAKCTKLIVVQQHSTLVLITNLFKLISFGEKLVFLIDTSAIFWQIALLFTAKILSSHSIITASYLKTKSLKRFSINF